MRLRSTAAGLAAVTVSGFLAVGTAHAATGSGAILSVDNATTAHCSDATVDSSTTPYCTIQAAVNAAAPGDTVQVKAGTVYTAETDVTTSGTAEAPITIEGVGGWATVQAIDDQYGFNLDGAQYVNLSGFNVEYAKSADVQLSGAQHIDVSGMRLFSEAASTATTGLPTSGVGFDQTSDSRVSTSLFLGAFGTAAVNLYGGGTGGDVVTTNVFSAPQSSAVTDVSVPDVAITGNTVDKLCGTGISVSAGAAGPATGTTIENNVLDGFACSDSIGIQGDSQDVSVADYNIVYPYSGTTPAASDYSWTQSPTSTTPEQYANGAAFCSATTYGCHDLNTDPYVNISGSLDTGQVVSARSPVIDSANSDAPGELATDFAGNARVDDLNVTDTGVGTSADYDRGAYEYQDPFAATGSTVLAMNLQATDAFSATAAVDMAVEPWGDVEYTYDFGDGTTAVSTSSASDTHHYAKLGTYTVTVTGVDAAGGTQSVTSSVTTAGSEYTAFGPTRILDTRKGIGAAKAEVGSNTVVLPVAGVDGLPASGITAVALHVTAVDTTGNGYVAANPDGVVNGTSLLNYRKGQTVSNSVIVPVAADGKIDLTNVGVSYAVQTDLLADVTGYFTGSTASGYTSLAPARLLDTRSGQGGTHAKVAGGHVIKLKIAGADGGSLPATGVTAVAVNLTAVDGSGNGFVTAYQDGLSAVPSTSNLNYAAGQTVASDAIVPVGGDGEIDLYVGGASTQSVDLIADVQGYYSASGASAYVPLAPTRVIDTRKTAALAQNYGTAYFDPIGVSDAAYLPSGLDAAYALPIDAAAWDVNLTAVEGTGHGLITAYPVLYGQTVVPAVSNLNYAPGQTVANYAQVTGGPADPWQSSVAFTNNGAQGTVELIADLYGFYGAN